MRINPLLILPLFLTIAACGSKGDTSDTSSDVATDDGSGSETIDSDFETSFSGSEMAVADAAFVISYPSAPR